MRKPLLLISVVCCLLFSGTTPLLSAIDRQDSLSESSVCWSLGSWFAARIPGLPLLTDPVFGSIFNDGPDPVETGEPEEDENTEDPPPENMDGVAQPLDSASGNIPGTRQ